jgi:urease accessory protein
MNKHFRSHITSFRFALPCVLLCIFANVSHAHPGHGAETGDIGWGLAHPLTGIDHLLAALTVGMLAMLLRSRSMVVTFLVSGVLGAFGGANMGAFAGLETLLAMSVLVFGLALAFRQQLTQSAALYLVGVFAAMHGWAHGSEATGAMSLTGIFLGTAAIVALGAAAAHFVRRAPRIVTGIGAGVATAAVAIMAGIL